ncbi:hypothetical protein SCH01S_48_00650 [Sphingomonas changbaiensis NBRC 104936]|uniref:DUF2188 domain-containing protein n=1 Tax=Sphingomonas changbaiensis NBRC 104936 TaxID=1219043 RepID=A0A0E9MRM8_9SPHN|nr:DUF2188 domain-containing protein [Sphingomonas changbaiensis]GAO40407.1 hypothetical protein SCH01S_48_00650 [Sphingomonas changbaiensis NBRC 104936]
MANDRNVWVVGSKDGWKVKREGASRASSAHRTQAEAWTEARKLAQQSRGEAFLQGLDGRIRERNSFGNDPHSRRG